MSNGSKIEHDTLTPIVLGAVSIMLAMESAVSELWAAAFVIAAVIVFSGLIWRRLNIGVGWRLLICTLIALVIGVVSYITFLRPNILLQTSNSYPFIEGNSDAHWLRVKAFNRGWIQARCRFSLNDVSNKEGTYRPLIDDDLLLSIGGGQEPEGGNAVVAEISPDRWKYVDLVNTGERAGPAKLTVHSQQFQLQFPNNLSPGVWIFSMSAEGTNCRADSIIVQVKYEEPGGKIVVLNPSE
jgi:hypothetical protein